MSSQAPPPEKAWGGLAFLNFNKAKRQLIPPPTVKQYRTYVLFHCVPRHREDTNSIIHKPQDLRQKCKNQKNAHNRHQKHEEKGGPAATVGVKAHFGNVFFLFFNIIARLRLAFAIGGAGFTRTLGICTSLPRATYVHNRGSQKASLQRLPDKEVFGKAQLP